ncbi:MAG: plastocyanin/azurin family copper-binding protein [Nitrospiria bacterium]
MRKVIERVLLLSIFLVSTSVVAQAKNIKVAMLNTGTGGAQMVFEPDFIEAAVGDTIEFVVTDVLHQPVSVSVPEGQKTWHTEPSQGVKVKVTKPGVIFFKCETHSILGMAGIIQVGGSKANLEAVEEATEEYTEALAMNQDRVTAFMGKIK